MESIRQKQISEVIRREISNIFLAEGRSIYGGTLVTVTKAKVTPDLLAARIYLSIYNAPDKEEVLEAIKDHKYQIQQAFVAAVRKQLRRAPQLEFFIDDTLDEAAKLDALFDKYKEEDKQMKDESTES